MGFQQSISHYAARPFKAEHPIGSGQVGVEYKPGDLVPASEWGPAANWLKESGKIFEAAGEPVRVDDPPASPVSQVREPVVHRNVAGRLALRR